MNFRSKSFIALSSAVCLTMALTTGCNTVDRTPQTPDQGVTPQIGQNMQGRNQGQGTLNVPGDNRGGLTGILPGGDNNQNGNISPGGINTRGGNNNYGGMQLNQPINTPTGFDKQRADNIRRQLVGINGLQNSNVIVNGNTALVGYRCPNPGTNTGDLRNTLTNTVRQIDNRITNVIATDTPNFVTEINKLVKDIGNNAQANGLNDRFNRLVQRITPNNNNINNNMNNMNNNMNNMNNNIVR